jgi:hypothetical protein
MVEALYDDSLKEGAARNIMDSICHSFEAKVLAPLSQHATIVSTVIYANATVHDKADVSIGS